MLKRRFKSFIGISYEGDFIENGLSRLNIFDESNLFAEYPNINKQMYRISRTRLHTKNRWNAILATFGGDTIEIVHTLRGSEDALREEKRFKPFTIRGAGNLFPTKAFLEGLLIGGLAAISEIPLLLLIGAFFIAIPLLQYVMRMLVYASPARNMRKIAHILLGLLKRLGFVKSSDAKVFVVTRKTCEGKICEIELLKASVHENNLFLSAMAEIYRRIDNPRYLIAYEDKKGLHTAYFNVPSILADNKAKAEAFYKEWQKHMSKGTLVYTRTEQGRKVLLRARKGSFDYTEKLTERQQGVKQGNWK
ncbi:hypothetical protein FACS1894111_04230 [Clostridia bacterium]|nr:hypothetical protein FACS1894111_04230 [Clostridia bacterium]